jgi:hypothetical protein
VGVSNINYFSETLESLMYGGFMSFSLKFAETFELESSILMLLRGSSIS